MSTIEFASTSVANKAELIRSVARVLTEDHVLVWEVVECFLSLLADTIHDRRDVTLPYFGRFTVQPDGSVNFVPSSMRGVLSRERLAEAIQADAMARSRLPDVPALPAAIPVAPVLGAET